MAEPAKGGLLFVLEVGCEEIPATMVRRAIEDLSAGLVESLGSLAAGATVSKDLGGARRIVALIDGIRETEPDREEVVTGPARSAAFDASGNPTKAALGFARGHGVAVGDLRMVPTPKGDVLAVTKRTRGRTAIEVLAAACPRVLDSMRFAKMMRWGDQGYVFVRPVHWIVSLLGAEVVPFEFRGVRSGRSTRGHRFLSPGPHDVRDAGSYARTLREKGAIEPSIEKRSRRLAELAGAEAASAGGSLRSDPDLLEELTFLTEHPAVIRGSFPEEYLSLPAPVLMTTMRHHQKYLTIDGPDGRLKNAFVAALTTDPDSEGTIRRGNEWVLKARLADAKFFFEEDQKRPLRERTADLAKVTFHARLGTYREKIDRMRRLVQSAGASLRHTPAMTEGDKRDLLDALELCKTDLTTGMVGEFPELQGVVGGIYLRMQGHTEGCARAAEEHYRPVSATSVLPSRGPASVIAIADKLDTLAVCFAAGLIPKGSADPYGLRRAATGILRILAENEIAADLERLVDAALAAAPAAAPPGTEKRPGREKAGASPASPGAALRDFLRQRLQFLMEESGIRFDAARAVLAAGWSDPLDAWRRARALNALRGQDDFLAVAAAAKRVRNILSQAREKGAAIETLRCDEKLISAGAESALRSAMEGASARVAEAASRADHERALSTIASLRPAVDRFFDEVLVMDPDDKVRANRLALLADLGRLLSREADFAEIVVEGETSGRRGSEVITGGTT